MADFVGQWNSGKERRALPTYQRIQINSLYLQPRCPTFNCGWSVQGSLSGHLGNVICGHSSNDSVMGSKSGVTCTDQLANHAP